MRLLDLRQVAERLEDEQSTPPSRQPFDLLAEERARLVERRRAVRLDADAERADRARDERALAGRLARELCGRARLSSRTCVLEPVLRELEPVRAEAVRLETSAPAFTYARCISRTRSGARRFSSS